MWEPEYLQLIGKAEEVQAGHTTSLLIHGQGKRFSFYSWDGSPLTVRYPRGGEALLP